MKRSLIVGSVALLVLAAGCADPEPPHRADVLADPVVTVLTVNGSGCPGSSATPAVAVDGLSITVAYTDFTAKAGTGSVPTEFRRNCQISIQVVSPGQTFNVTSTTEHGVVDLPAGATASQRTTYFLASDPPGPPFDHAASGPLSGAWDKADANPFLAPCGTTRNLNVNVELVVRSPGPAASLSLNGVGPGTTISLGFTPCP